MQRVIFCLFLIAICLAAPPPAAEGGYAVALFPIKVIANWGEGYALRTETLAVEGILNMIKDDPLLRLKYTYHPGGHSTDTLLLKDAVGGYSGNVWRQSSFFANFSPNWPRIKATGSGLKADLAILVRIRHDEDNLVAVYLYDYKNGKIYSKTSQGIYYGSSADGVQRIAETLMQGFYSNQ